MWHTAPQASALDIPPHLRPWMFDTQNLTHALQACAQTHQMHVLQQYWSTLHPQQLHYLKPLLEKNAAQQEHWFREITHTLDDQIVMFARVIVPHDTYTQLSYELEDLENKPIGQTLLYNNPKVSRSDFEYAKIKSSALESPICEGAPEQNHYFWRRSTFSYSHWPLVIEECFFDKLVHKPILSMEY